MKVQIFGVIKRAVVELKGKPGVFVDERKNQTRIEYLYQDSILTEKGVCECEAVTSINHRPDYYQLVVGLKDDIDGLTMVIVDGKTKDPFYKNEETGVKKYSFGSGRILKKRGKRITEIMLALVVREHKPYLLRRDILDCEIPSGIDKEMIKMAVPGISDEALQLLLDTSTKTSVTKTKKVPKVPKAPKEKEKLATLGDAFKAVGITQNEQTSNK